MHAPWQTSLKFVTKFLSIGFIVVVATLIHSTAIHAAYTCTGGGDHGGSSWDPAATCPGGIAGVQYDIGTLSLSGSENGSVYSGANGSICGSNFNGSCGSVTIYATTVSIPSGTSLSANTKGNPGGTNGGNGSGAGDGLGSASAYAGGAAYGGAGGTGTNAAGGSAYGSSIDPVSLGSGGGASGSAAGGAGGGAITMVVSGTITVNGTISSNGGNNGGLGAGGGSGGTVNIQSGTITGTGTIQAIGGNGTNSGANNSGNGSGGRIVVYYGTNSWSGNSLTSSVATAAGTGGAAAGNGTITAAAATTPTVASLTQFQSNCTTSVSAGGTITTSTACFKATLNDSDGSDTLSLQVEVQQSGVAFTNVPTVTGTGVAFSGSGVTGSTTVTEVTGLNYHWQARTIDQSGVASPWSAFGNIIDFAGTGYTCTLGGTHGGAAFDPAASCPSGVAGIQYDIGTLSLTGSETSNVYAESNGVNCGGSSGVFVLCGSVMFQATTVTIPVGTTLNATGEGFPAGNGPGAGNSGNAPSGGAYGGYGGTGTLAGVGGSAYGSYLNPTFLGSGGGIMSTYGDGGATGGGAIIIQASGTTTITGSVTSNGVEAGFPFGIYCNSGGAGGTVNITTATFTGSGSVTATGGNSGSGDGGTCGSGGGGRVAITYATANTYSGTVGASMGTGGNTGDNGTAIILNSSTNDLYIPATSSWEANPYVEGTSFTYNSITVENNATWDLEGYYTTNSNGVGQSFTVGNFTLNSGSTINMNGFGYPTTLGPGAGAGNTSPGGGAYGGYGGSGNGAGGTPYGSFTAPINLGSGGGTTAGGCNIPGGTGAGAFAITVSGTTTINGAITANGTNGGQGCTGTLGGGGGSGGSIYISTGSFAGSGSMSANGGNAGLAGSGNGGGGRIAVTYTGSNSYGGTGPNVLAGTGGNGGETGTAIIYDSTTNDLLIQSNNTWHANPTLEGETFSYHNVTVSNNATWNLVGYYTTGSNGLGQTFNATNFTVNSGSTVDANAEGYAAITGPGHGSSSGGGGYGGAGGGSVAGGTYGSCSAPTDLGSGGATGVGGGAVKINSTGTTTISGILESNGGNGNNGAGSGGSVWVKTGTLTGAGTFEAAGGNATSTNGNGGGGRVAVDYTISNNWTGNALTAASVAPAGTGGAGGANGTLCETAIGSPTIASLHQNQADCATNIASGGPATALNVCLTATGTDTLNPDVLTLQIEVQINGTSFTNVANIPTNTGSVSGSNITIQEHDTSIVYNDSYHWQARLVDSEGYASAWTPLGGNPDFTVPTIPNVPTSLHQFHNDGVTAIANNTWTSDGISTNVVFSFIMTSPNGSDTLTPEIELQPSGGSFTGTPNHTGSSVTYTGIAVTGVVDVTGLTNCNGYKWEAYVGNGVGVSGGTVFNVTVPNFSVQNTGPIAGSVFDGSSNGSENSSAASLTTANANWTGFSDSCSGLPTTPYQVAIGTTSGGVNVLGYTSSGITLGGSYNTYTNTSLNMQTGTTYYISVKATNIVGLSTIVTSSGQSILPSLSFNIGSSSVALSDWNVLDNFASTGTSTVSVLTNGFNGYNVYAYETGLLTNTGNAALSVPDFSNGSFQNPATWPLGVYGFGYTSTASSINGSNLYGSGRLYAPFSQTNPGNVVAQNVSGVTGNTYTGTADSYTITYKAAVQDNQSVGSYTTNIIYTIVPSF